MFSLDTDERMTPALQEEIRNVLGQPTAADAYFVPRKNFFLGRWIQHCGWYPDYRQPHSVQEEPVSLSSGTGS